jgi:putative aldouronate transport system substrate-binding protein
MGKSKISYSFVLVMCMVLTLILSACGGSSGGGETTNEGADKPVELIWYTIGTPKRK